MKVLEEAYIGQMALKNRVVMPPMCMYEADALGMAKPFHYTHYETRAVGGVGLIIIEATAVLDNGRISDKDLGIWSDDHIEGLSEIVERIKKHGAKAGIQLAHAGRKCGANTDRIIGPSAISFSKDYRTPDAMNDADIQTVIDGFVAGAKRAVKAGFDFIEIHAAHGYLLHSFLSPITNKRTDSYGGELSNRCRLLQKVIDGVKQALPPHIPIGIRVSASDYIDGGIDIHMMTEIIDLLKENLDIVHVSSGAIAPTSMKVYPGYQVDFAREIKYSCNIDTIAVGLITNSEMIEEILNNERADFVALGRLLLREPYFVMGMYHSAGHMDSIPEAYKRGF